MHMATLQYLFSRNIYANVKLHFYNRQNMSYELFSIRNYSSGPIIGESHNIGFFMSMGSSVIISCSFTLLSFSFYKSSMTGAFFMRFDTRT